MPALGQIALVRFPSTDLEPGKLRPVLLLAQCPGRHGDWLVAMVSSQLHQQVAGFDAEIHPGDDDFQSSGLKVASLVRLGRLAVLDVTVLAGALGHVAPQRVANLRERLVQWLGERA